VAKRDKSCISTFSRTCLTLLGVTILLTLGAQPASAERVTQSQNLNQTDVDEQTASCVGRSARSEQVQSMDQANDAAISDPGNQPQDVGQRNAAAQISSCGSVPPEVSCRHEQIVIQRNGKTIVHVDTGGC